jgi:hypothetical protein
MVERGRWWRRHNPSAITLDAASAMAVTTMRPT